MINLAFLSTAHIHTKGFLRAANEKEGCRVAAIWDDRESRGRRFAEECGADLTIKDVDGMTPEMTARHGYNWQLTRISAQERPSVVAFFDGLKKC